MRLQFVENCSAAGRRAERRRRQDRDDYKIAYAYHGPKTFLKVNLGNGEAEV